MDPKISFSDIMVFRVIKSLILVAEFSYRFSHLFWQHSIRALKASNPAAGSLLFLPYHRKLHLVNNFPRRWPSAPVCWNLNSRISGNIWKYAKFGQNLNDNSTFHSNLWIPGRQACQGRIITTYVGNNLLSYYNWVRGKTRQGKSWFLSISRFYGLKNVHKSHIS